MEKEKIDSEEFSQSLLTAEGVSTAQKLGVEYLIYFGTQAEEVKGSLQELEQQGLITKVKEFTKENLQQEQPKGGLLDNRYLNDTADYNASLFELTSGL